VWRVHLNQRGNIKNEKRRGKEAGTGGGRPNERHGKRRCDGVRDALKKIRGDIRGGKERGEQQRFGGKMVRENANFHE